MRASVYLDHQSAGPLRPEALEAMRPFLTEQWGNPSGLHRRAHRAREALARARAQAAAFLGAQADDIIFTSSGTEAANLALRGAAEAMENALGEPFRSAIGSGREHVGTIITTRAEHPAVLAGTEWLGRRGWQAELIGVDNVGRIDGAGFAASIKQLEAGTPLLAALQLANHDIGTRQPVRESAALVHEANGVLFCDATAAAGWMPIDVASLGADLLSISPQRLGGPKGVGVLYRRPGTRLAAQTLGGNQEQGLRGGTENLPGIVGAGVALELAARELEERIAHAAQLQQMLWDGLREKVTGLHLNGPEPGPERLPNQLNLSVEGLEGEALLLALDAQGVQVHAGASCVAKQLKVPPVLAAIGLEPRLAQGSVTLSLGPENTEKEIRRVLEVFPKVVTRLRAMSPARGGPPTGVTMPNAAK